jgi:hypothetical protein
LPIEAIQEINDDNKIKQNIFNIKKLNAVDNFNIGELIDILVVVKVKSLYLTTFRIILNHRLKV